MSIDDVKAKVEAIIAIAANDEAAHAKEDELHIEVMSAIADGRCDSPAADLAREALKTRNIEFCRWYA